MENLTIIIIIIGIIILYIIFLKIKRKKRWIFERDVETPGGKSKLYFVEGIDNIFKSENEAIEYAKRLK